MYIGHGVFRCNSSESRTAAYELLTELSNHSLANLSDICHQLLEMHHLPNRDIASEWEVRVVYVIQVSALFKKKPSVAQVVCVATEDG